jgi:hypothetical protein
MSPAMKAWQDAELALRQQAAGKPDSRTNSAAAKTAAKAQRPSAPNRQHRRKSAAC